MSIAGKFIRVGEEGFTDFMIKEGVPANILNERKDEKNIVEIKVDGQKIIQSIAFGDRPARITEFILGQEVEEKMSDGIQKSTATLTDNILTIVSRTEEGKERTRILKFTDTGIDFVIKSSNGEGKLFYKRE